MLHVMATLAVVGAGQKGIAIAAEARGVRAVGLGAPRVVRVDRGAVAGKWGGRQGYTNGLLSLGTPAEKDVGYPYADSWGAASSAVTAAMADYSWQRHLIAHGVYADWVDRGRLRPTHRQWSYYLRQVAERARAEIITGEVVGLEAVGERWQLALEAGGGRWAGRRVMPPGGRAAGRAQQPQPRPRRVERRG